MSKSGVLASSLFAFLAALLCPGVEAADNCWLLLQKSKLVGDQKVYVSPLGLRIENKNMGFTAVARPGDSGVVMFNVKDKTYCTETFADWRGYFVGRVAAFSDQDLNYNDVDWKKTGASQKLAGLTALQYKMMHGQTAPTAHSGTIKKAPPKRQAEYWVTEDLKISQKLSDVLCRLYGLPQGIKGIPLRGMYRDGHRSPNVGLDTVDSTQTSVSATFFAPPGGFKHVKNSFDIIMNTREGLGMIQDLANSLGDFDDDKHKGSKVLGKKGRGADGK